MAMMKSTMPIRKTSVASMKPRVTVEHERQRADERTAHGHDHDEPARGQNPAPHRARSALVQRRPVSCDG
jgi:hypothetical protein